MQPIITRHSQRSAHSPSLTAYMIDTITIDGPAGSGKSTIGLGIAKALGFLYFDTGVMYRAVTLAALLRNIDSREEEKCHRWPRQFISK